MADPKAEMSPRWPEPIRLPEKSDLSLRDQICEQMSAAISAGAVSPHLPLPSCRQMASELGVSRNTVFAAYSRLADLKLIVSRDRSGYFVNPDLFCAGENSGFSPCNRDPIPSPVSFSPSSLVPLENPLDWRNYPYPFIYNQIDPNLFPTDGWRECSRIATGSRHTPQWTGDLVESDSPDLVDQLRQRLLRQRGIVAGADEVLITLGAQNALCIIGQLFAEFGSPIAVENPGYFGAVNAFRMTNNNLVGVPVDSEGIIPSAIPHGVKLVFTTPSHQFPTMVTMSPRRRRELLDVAAKNEFIIIEDDYEAEMNFEARSSPTLRSLDDRQRVIYVSSFSKTLSPGIRLGFIVAHPDIIREARLVRGTMYRHPPTILQNIVATFIRLGYFDSHLRKLDQRYRRRWHAMRASISRHLPMLHCTSNRGGTSFWLTGPDGFNGVSLRERLKKRGVLVDSGEKFYLDRDCRNGLRLGFAFVPVERLDAGVMIIAEEVEAVH